MPARIVLATLLGIIRGDKHMANAYPPARRSAVVARDGNNDVASTPNPKIAAKVDGKTRYNPGATGHTDRCRRGWQLGF